MLLGEANVQWAEYHGTAYPFGALREHLAEERRRNPALRELFVRRDPHVPQAAADRVVAMARDLGYDRAVQCRPYPVPIRRMDPEWLPPSFSDLPCPQMIRVGEGTLLFADLTRDHFAILNSSGHDDEIPYRDAAYPFTALCQHLVDYVEVSPPERPELFVRVDPGITSQVARTVSAIGREIGFYPVQCRPRPPHRGIVPGYVMYAKDISAEAVLHAFHERQAELDACYHRGEEGEVQVELFVGADGRVSRARWEWERVFNLEHPMDDTGSATDCLLDKVRATTFEPPPHGRIGHMWMELDFGAPIF
jgi:hypothetical protein